jgi:hypothetical protein
MTQCHICKEDMGNCNATLLKKEGELFHFHTNCLEWRTASCTNLEEFKEAAFREWIQKD